MKTNRIRMVLMGLALIVDVRAGLAADERRVVIHVREGNFAVPGLARAERTASAIFERIGIAVVFRGGSSRKSGEQATFSIEMELDSKVPPEFHPGAMAYAMPYGASGTRVHVFCDRVLKTTPDAGTGTIMGYVMAHEIAHVLEGVNRHSADGVMKAHWESADYRRMISGAVPFASTDEDLIHAALEKSATRLAASTPHAVAPRNSR